MAPSCQRQAARSCEISVLALGSRTGPEFNGPANGLASGLCCPHPFPHILHHPPSIHFGVNGPSATLNKRLEYELRLDFEKIPQYGHIVNAAFFATAEGPRRSYRRDETAFLSLREFHSPSRCRHIHFTHHHNLPAKTGSTCRLQEACHPKISLRLRLSFTRFAADTSTPNPLTHPISYFDLSTYGYQKTNDVGQALSPRWESTHNLQDDVNRFSRACEDSPPISNDGRGAQSSCRK